MTTTTYNTAACGNGTRGIWSGGFRPSASNILDYITIATTGNATDFGDSTAVRSEHGATANATRGVFAGGSGVINMIDYVTIASPGNATDFGDLTVARRGASGLSGD